LKKTKSRLKRRLSENLNHRLALGELLAPTSLVEADFLTLDFTCIAGYKTSLLEFALQA
jgi:hypothetical protein